MRVSLRTKLILTFLGALAIAAAVAVLSVLILLGVGTRLGGEVYMETMQNFPARTGQIAASVAGVLAAGGDMAAVQQAALKELPPGARVQVVRLDGTIWADSGGEAGRRVTGAEALRWLEMEQDSPPGLVFTEPVLTAGETLWGYTVLSRQLDAPLPFKLRSGSPAQSTAALVVFGFQGLALVAALLLFITFGRHAVRPIGRLSAVVSRIAAGDLEARTGLGARGDELGQLGRDVDAMAASLQQARQQAAAADEARRFTVAALSHDLRTPLTGLLAHAEALRAGIAEDPEQSLAVIHDKGLQMRDLLDDLFELAALEADHGQWSTTRTDVAELVRRAVAALLPNLEQAGIAVEAEIPDGPVWADLPRNKLERVLDNLLSNARKYGARGGWLGVRVAAGSGTAVIEVADHGPGISPAEQAHIFDRYYRTATARAGHARGSGLGLAVAHELVTRLHGRISVQSPPEGGARFRVELPAVQPSV